MGRCKPPGIGSHEFYVSKPGGLYIKGLSDGILTGMLFPVHGHFKTGAEANGLLEQSGGSIIPYKLSEDSEVFLRGKQGGNLPGCLTEFSKNSAPLSTILRAITAGGLPNVSLHLHKIESQNGDAGVGWKVSALEPACLKPTIQEPDADSTEQFPPSEIQPAKLSSFMDISQCKRLKTMFVLEYDSQSNKLKGMLPQVCATSPLKFSKDTICQL